MTAHRRHPTFHSQIRIRIRIAAPRFGTSRSGNLRYHGSASRQTKKSQNQTGHSTLALGIELPCPAVLQRTLMNLGSCASSDVSMKSSGLYRNHKNKNAARVASDRPRTIATATERFVLPPASARRARKLSILSVPSLPRPRSRKRAASRTERQIPHQSRPRRLAGPARAPSSLPREV